MKKLLLILTIAACSSNTYAYYQAQEGRWISRDPIGEKGGLNIYSFVGNHPVIYVDPLGLNVYGIDGTWFNAEYNQDDADISNTYDFTQATSEISHYYGGPGGASKGAARHYRGATGAEISRIIKTVKKQICEDYCSSKGTTTVNIVGWSRGATVALEVASRLNSKGCKCDDGCEYKPVPVNFLGLYDPVDMTILNPLDIFRILPGDQGYPNQIPENIQNNLVQVKTANQAILPTTKIKGANTRSYQFKNGAPTTHSNIGTSSGVTGVQQDMKNAASRAGVQF